tara:strand:- start:741 stop:953 length:213 start_codon:yes stop_codon:yes gene_type:complete
MGVRKKFKNESFESLMKRFKKSVEKRDTINEVKRREQFEKPSLGRRKARELARKKELKRQEDQNIHRSHA